MFCRREEHWNIKHAERQLDHKAAAETSLLDSNLHSAAAKLTIKYIIKMFNSLIYNIAIVLF